MLMDFCSIRFAPPLVITDEELERAVTIIASCFADFDIARLFSLPPSIRFPDTTLRSQLDEIPGEFASEERGHEEHVGL
jgi:hypothetical protein